MRELLLYGKHGLGKVAIVDDDVYEWATQWKWSITVGRNGRNSNVSRSARFQGKVYHIRLYHCVIGNPINDGIVVDHIDRNILNNQRENLRYCTFRENAWNASIGKNNSSGVKGVHWDPRKKTWVASIRGRFSNIEDAINFRNAGISLLHGEFAVLNPSILNDVDT